MDRTITVEGMSCGHCEQTVEKALQETDGVDDAKADHEAQEATVRGDADPGALVAAIENAGYDADA